MTAIAKASAGKFRIRIVFSVLLLVFVLVQLPMVFLNNRVIWDEAVYIGMGKYIFSGGHSGLWESLRPVGLPIVLGLFWKLGFGHLPLFKLVVLLFAVAISVLVYLIGKKIGNCSAGILAVTFLLFSPVFFLNSSLVLTDVPSAFFMLAAVYFFLDGLFFASGIFGSLAFIFRFPHFIVSMALFFAFLVFFEPRKKWIKSVILYFIPVILVLAVFMAVNYQMYKEQYNGSLKAAIEPFVEASYAQKNQVYAIGGFAENLLFYLRAVLVQNYLLLLFIPGAILAIIKKSREGIVVSVCSLAYFAYFTWIVNKQERFLVSFLPLLCILSAYFILFLADAVNLKSFLAFFHSKKNVSASLFLLVLIALLFFTVPSLKSLYAYSMGYYTVDQKMAGYYGFFEKNSLRGAVLTTDPVFAAYSDNLFIPYYYSLDNALARYEQYFGRFDYVAYNPAFVPCEYIDGDCEQKKASVFSRIAGDGRVVFNQTIGSAQYYVFSMS